MARLIYLAIRHRCTEEIDEDPKLKGLYIGSIVECSCGEWFIRREDQRDGEYWGLYEGEKKRR